MGRYKSCLLMGMVFTLATVLFSLPSGAQYFVDKRPGGCGASLVTVPVAGETSVIVEDRAVSMPIVQSLLSSALHALRPKAQDT